MIANLCPITRAGSAGAIRSQRVLGEAGNETKLNRCLEMVNTCQETAELLTF